MAKAKNTEEVTGGLTANLNFGTSEDAKTRNMYDERGREEPRSGTSASIVEGYQKTLKRRHERRNVKLNIMLKLSTSNLLEEALERGEIRSKNDLINYLLEEYFANQKKGGR